MDALEKLIAVILVAVFLLLVPAGMSLRDAGNILEICVSESVNDMQSNISTNKVLTVEQCSSLCSLVYSCGYRDGIEITEYYSEKGVDGNSYQYSVTYDEICMELMDTGVYRFKEGSFIYICVAGYSPDNMIAKILYGRKTISISIYL